MISENEIAEFFKHVHNLKHLADIPLLSEKFRKLEEQVYNNKVEDTLGDIIPPDKICEVLKISPRTLFSLRKRGSISYHKIGKNIIITRAQLLEFLSAHEVKASNRISSTTINKSK